MSETFLGSANIIETGIRTVFSMLDRPAYWLLEMVYQLFFNVASADIFANGMVMKFYGRIQMILSVFMMFQLALIILKGIMNPDSFYDKKAGVGSFVTRVVVALVLLVLMVPIKTGGQNEFDDQIASNGLLFGTLYSLQHRILANNTIGKLVMGSSATDYMSDSSDTEDLKKASRIFTSTVLRGFYRINLLPEDDRPRHEDGKDDAVFNDNRVCQDIDDKVLDSYTKLDADPGDIIGLINETCEPNLSLNVPILSSTSGSKKYAFTFMPIISTIVGFMFAFILLSFTIDIAVRAVKLAVLRLIAPIPIISYMNPKGSTDTAFNSWVKTLTSTYLDLFIRLAAVYFVIAIIQEMIAHGIYINHGNGLIGILSLILIWIGLFVFAKQAPKLARYYMDNKDLLVSQTGYADRIIGKKDAEFYALARVGAYSYAKYYVAFRDNTKWAAAVVTEVDTPWGGLKRPVFQNHAVSICERDDDTFISFDEAHYICGILNTNIVAQYMETSSDARSFPIRPRIKIPRFDGSNATHMQISTLSKQAHQNYDDKQFIDSIRKQLDTLYLSIL